MNRTEAMLAGVWIALLVLLGATIALARVDLGGANAPAALAIAGLKVALALWFFMELRRSDVATRGSAASGLALLLALIALVWADDLARTGQGHP
jgi:caa(3)-type oxidase subunit IV